jgi:hypothetical protein
LFSKKENEKSIQNGWSNTTLALFLDVDFEIIDSGISLHPYWIEKLQKGEVTEKDLEDALIKYNNVVTEIRATLKVIK